MRSEMAAVKDTQVNRLAIVAAARVGLHEMRKTAVARPTLVTWTYMGVGAVLILLSGFGNDKGLLAAAGLVTVIMALAVYMNQRQERSCALDIDSCERELSDLVGPNGALAEVRGAGVVASTLRIFDRSREWSKCLLREFGTHVAWVLAAAVVLGVASGMAEGWQMAALQITAIYLVLSVLASDFRSVRTLMAWSKAVRSAKEAEASILASIRAPSEEARMAVGRDIELAAIFLEKLDAQGGSSDKMSLQMAVGVEREIFASQLDLLVTDGLVAPHGERDDSATIRLTEKGEALYASLLALLEKALKIGV
jgi:predicted transcriptional regulator